MGTWNWRLLFRPNRGQADGTLPERFERALRGARPACNDLSESRAEQILAAALAEARRPRRTFLPKVTVAGALTLACGVLIAGLMVPSHKFQKQGGRLPIAAAHRPPKQPPFEWDLSGGTRGFEAHNPAARLKRHPLLVALISRRHTTVHGKSIWKRKRFQPQLEASALIQSQVVAPSKSLDTSVIDVEPEKTTGHLIVVFTDDSPGRLNVVVTSGSEDRTGFAKVSAYSEIGPGGGVLTQCTARDEMKDDISTVQYGIVYGRSVTLLTGAQRHPEDYHSKPENRLQFERGNRP